MTNPNPEAVKADNEQELEKLEAELEAELAKEAEVEDPEATAAEDEKPAPESVTEEKNEVEDPEPDPEPEGDVPEEEDDGKELEDTEVDNLSKKAQRRFRKLSKELEDAKKQLDLRDRYEPKQEEPQQENYKLPWEVEKEEPGTEVNVEELVEKRSREIAQEELKKEKILQTLKSDTESVQAKYPELNPEVADRYDPVLVDKIALWYKALFQQNSEVRLADVVEDVMDLTNRGKEQGKSEVTGKILKQASEQALTPSTARTETTSAFDAINSAKTVEELEALEGMLS